MSLPPAPRRAFRLGVFEIDLDARELRKRGLRVKLAHQPFEILGAVIERPGEIVTREELRSRLWPNQPFGDHDHSLNKAVTKIREVLGDSADSPRFLETIPRVGYRLLVSPEPLFGPATSQETDRTSEPQGPQQKPRLRRLQWVVALLVVAVLLVWISVELGTSRARKPGRTLSPVPLTSYLGVESSPSFSPDGSRIAFTWDGEAQDNSDIYVIGVAGGPTLRLTRDARPDYAPAWSPDGRSIAFIRAGEGKMEVLLIPPEGGEERKIGVISRSVAPRLAWSADSGWLILPDMDSAGGHQQLVRLSVRDGERRTLISDSPGALGDYAPAISRDGRQLAFARAVNPSWKEIFVAGLTPDLRLSEPPRQVTDLHKETESLAWAANGTELVFSAGGVPGGPRFLYRVKPLGPGLVTDLADVRMEGSYPAVSPDGQRLVYAQKNLEQVSVWRMDLDSAGRSMAAPPRRLISSTGQDFNADISPDGQRIVFRSNRSGSPELWVCGPDGLSPRRITFLGDNGASAPRWSPDGKRIAFESRSAGHSDIYVVEPDSATMQKITSHPADNYLPNWSRDGNQIYFCSTRSGSLQVWRVKGTGGAPVQITRHGGVYAIETLDRSTLYYSTPGSPSTLRRVPADGGTETEVARRLVGLSGIAMVPAGIYYLEIPAAPARASIRFFSLSTNASRPVATIPMPLHHGISVSSDSRLLLYSTMERRETDLMLVENFR